MRFMTGTMGVLRLVEERCLFMIDYEKELNAEQLAVVKNGDGPCLVLAGAGSGKTRTITYRVAHLLEAGVKPDEILLVTFTNKAAKEMLERVEFLMRRDPPLAPPHQGGEYIRLPWSGTFHHICFRILHTYAPLLGYKNNFTILDSGDSTDLMKLCLRQEGIDRTERRYPSAGVLHSLVSYARNAERSLEDVVAEKHPNWLEIAPVLTRIAADYARRKREANTMDFDDLLVNTHLLLLKSEAARRRYGEQFRYILVDEYQDTNKIQASLVALLASVHRNILVVGDDAQSIYSFRAAEIANILSFSAKGGFAFGGKGYPDAKTFFLATNYRSTPDILQVANEVIANNKDQYRKELKSVLPASIKPQVHPFADGPEEADFIVQEILTLRDEGVPLGDMAVLFRAAFHSQALEMELTKRDIPYEYRGGVRFFERAHVKDVLAWLRIVHNLDDTIAWSRVLNMQTGIGPAAAEVIIQKVQGTRNKPASNAFSIADAGGEQLPLAPCDLLLDLTPRAHLGWQNFLQVWQAMEKIDEKRPTDLIDAVINSKYAEYLESEYPDYRERLQDIEQLARFAERQSGLQQFLADATLQESYTARQANHSGNNGDEEKLILSTIHQAKGLEWRAVFIMNVAAGQFPSDRSLRETKGLEEERRLFYVAITRAKKYLYLSYPLVGSFSSTLSGPSMFLDEIDYRLLDAHKLEAETVFHPPASSGDDIIYVAEEEPFASRPARPAPKSFLRSIDEL